MVPPPTEQTAIVRFLDHADRRIRRYIRAKQKLIALLEEQKQAIIHQAVTGQIDVRTGQPYPSYKDSGVEWLDKVPEALGYWRPRSAPLFQKMERPVRVPKVEIVTPQRYRRWYRRHCVRTEVGVRVYRPGSVLKENC